MLLCMQAAGEALRAWGTGKGLPSCCSEAAHSAVPCPCERLSQPQLFFAEGLAQPSPEHEIQPPAAAAGSRIPAVRLSMQRCPHAALPSRPALPSPHSPSSAGTWPQQLWLSARRELLLALVSVCSASSHTVFTSPGASAICCTDFTQVRWLRCQCVFGGSLTAPREMSCPWRGALVSSVQARTPWHPRGRPEPLLGSQAGSHVCWHTLPRLPMTCCSLMALNRVPGMGRSTQ